MARHLTHTEILSLRSSAPLLLLSSCFLVKLQPRRRDCPRPANGNTWWTKKMNSYAPKEFHMQSTKTSRQCLASTYWLSSFHSHIFFLLFSTVYIVGGNERITRCASLDIDVRDFFSASRVCRRAHWKLFYSIEFLLNRIAEYERASDSLLEKFPDCQKKSLTIHLDRSSTHQLRVRWWQ